MSGFHKRLEGWLDSAQKQYLLQESEFCSVTLRRRPGMADDYQQLESFLRGHPQLVVSNYRRVKEGRVFVSRPSEIRIPWDCLLSYRPALRSLREEFQEWQSQLRRLNLDGFLSANYQLCLRDPLVTRSCLQVFEFLVSSRLDPEAPWLLPRQLPHSESTKLIGREALLLKLFGFWRGEEGSWSMFYRRFRILRRALEFRFYAPQCKVQGHSVRSFHGIVSRDWKADYEFPELVQTLIVENRQTMQALARESQRTLLIFGSGWGVSQIVDLLDALPKPLFYWGDIDKEGFEIVAHLFELGVELQPLMMGQEIYSQYRHMAVKKTAYFGPFKTLPKPLQETYESVCRNGEMIEQEKLPLQELPVSL